MPEGELAPPDPRPYKAIAAARPDGGASPGRGGAFPPPTFAGESHRQASGLGSRITDVQRCRPRHPCRLQNSMKNGRECCDWRTPSAGRWAQPRRLSICVCLQAPSFHNSGAPCNKKQAHSNRYSYILLRRRRTSCWRLPGPQRPRTQRRRWRRRRGRRRTPMPHHCRRATAPTATRASAGPPARATAGPQTLRSLSPPQVQYLLELLVPLACLQKRRQRQLLFDGRL